MAANICVVAMLIFAVVINSPSKASSRTFHVDCYEQSGASNCDLVPNLIPEPTAVFEAIDLDTDSSISNCDPDNPSCAFKNYMSMGENGLLKDHSN